MLVAELLTVCSLLRVPLLPWLQEEWLTIVPRPPSVVRVMLPVLLCEPFEALVLWKSWVLVARVVRLLDPWKTALLRLRLPLL